MKRREFLKRGALATAGAAVATSGVTAVAYAAGEATKPGALDDPDRSILIKMARQIYPHDRLDDAYYGKVVDELDADAAKDPAVAKLLREGIANLDQVGGAKFVTLSSDNQIVALRRIEDSPFFQKVRSTALVALYNNRDVWKHFAYPGASFPIGGYIHHGFNDLKWLPDPPASASPKPA